MYYCLGYKLKNDDEYHKINLGEFGVKDKNVLSLVDFTTFNAHSELELKAFLYERKLIPTLDCKLAYLKTKKLQILYDGVVEYKETKRFFEPSMIKEYLLDNYDRQEIHDCILSRLLRARLAAPIRECFDKIVSTSSPASMMFLYNFSSKCVDVELSSLIIDYLNYIDSVEFKYQDQHVIYRYRDSIINTIFKYDQALVLFFELNYKSIITLNKNVIPSIVNCYNNYRTLCWRKMTNKYDPYEENIETEIIHELEEFLNLLKNNNELYYLGAALSRNYTYNKPSEKHLSLSDYGNMPEFVCEASFVNDTNDDDSYLTDEDWVRAGASEEDINSYERTRRPY